MPNRMDAVIDFAKEPLRETHRTLDRDRVIAGEPQHKVQCFHENEVGNLLAGVWESTPGKWHAFTGRDEFCYIIEGHVRLTDAKGNSQTFRTGDAFLIPNGFDGTWEVLETTKKHYVILDYNKSQA